MGRQPGYFVIFSILLILIISSLNGESTIVNEIPDTLENFFFDTNEQNPAAQINEKNPEDNEKIAFEFHNAAGLYNGKINYSDVLLVMNNQSQMSIEIGNYFAKARGLSGINICNVSMSTAETTDSSGFSDLRTKIQNHITNNGLTTKINYIVTTKGVPLRVNYGGGARASVDAELALILGGYSNRIGGSGWDDSPYFNKDEVFSKEKLDMYLVTRLTGYTVEEAKGLVDKATNSYEKRGMFMLDVSPGKDGGGYQIGNTWMRNAYTILNNKGFNVTLDQSAPFITGVKNVSGYASWGSNDGAYSTNYVSNGNLESDSDGNGVPNNWYLQKDYDDCWARNRSDNQSSYYSMEVIRPAVNSNYSAISQNITVQPGVRYWMTGYVNFTNMSSTGKGVFLSVAAVDGSGNVVEYHNGSARRSNTNDFVSLSQAHYEAVPGVTKVTVSVVVAECSGTVHIDTIRFREIKPHNTWIDGAIAETYVSTGGRSFNYPTAYGQSLVADLIREGVTGVKGYVYEPYLDAIAEPDILFDRYTDGYNLAESYYMASRWISWMGVVVGDPKVAPYIDLLPELTASQGDINFSIGQPNEGDRITVTGTIHNLGKAAANNFKVQLYIGDPEFGGVELGAPKELPVGANSNIEITETWSTNYLQGWYNIYMVIDAENVIREQMEFNNVVNRTIYINARPSVLDIKVSKGIVPRTNSITITINGSDTETPEGKLFCMGDLRHSLKFEETDWIQLPNPTYSGQFWTFNYTFNSSADLGYYDLRFKFSDNHTATHPGESDWLKKIEAFEVKNNNPYINSISVSKPEIFREESVEINITANDFETELENIDCKLQLQYPETTTWKNIADPDFYDDYWLTVYTPAKDAPLGNYSFRAIVYDDEQTPGASSYFYLTEALEVKNNPVILHNISLESNYVYRLDKIEISMRVTDIEDAEEELIGTIEYRFNGTGSAGWKALTKLSYTIENDVGYWACPFKPRKNAELGKYDFRAKFTDSDDGDSGWLNIDNAVSVLNNLPVIAEVEVTADQVVRNESVTITVTGRDREHIKSDLKCEISLSPSNDSGVIIVDEEVEIDETKAAGWVQMQVEPLTNRWEAVFQTDLSTPIDLYHIRVRLLDPDIVESKDDIDKNTLWDYSLDIFKVRRGFPALKDVTFTPDTIKPGESTKIQITTDGNSSENDELTCIIQYQDPDGEWNSLTATYDRNTGAGVWNAVITSGETSEPGIYKIRVQFLSSLLGSTGWITPTAFLTVEGAQPSGKDDDKDQLAGLTGTSTPILIAVALLIVVVVIALILFILIRKKYQKKKEEKQIEGAWQLKPIGTEGQQLAAEAQHVPTVYTAEVISVPGEQAGMPEPAPVPSLPPGEPQPAEVPIVDAEIAETEGKPVSESPEEQDEEQLGGEEPKEGQEKEEEEEIREEETGDEEVKIESEDTSSTEELQEEETTEESGRNTEEFNEDGNKE